MIKNIIILLLLIFFGRWCYHQLYPATWSGFFYPYGNLSDESRWRIEHGFKSLKACRDWANDQMETTEGEDDYECGKNCRSENKGYTFYICDETLD